MERSRSEKLLILVMRLSGIVTLAAFPTAFLPHEWMARTHGWLGMGELPALPVVDYMARSLSMLYGFHGVLMLVVASDVRRYSKIVTFLAIEYLILGLAMSTIDLVSGMPGWWMIAEGPPVGAMGLLMLWLRRSIPPG